MLQSVQCGRFWTRGHSLRSQRYTTPEEMRAALVSSTMRLPSTHRNLGDRLEGRRPAGCDRRSSVAWRAVHGRPASVASTYVDSAMGRTAVSGDACDRALPRKPGRSAGMRARGVGCNTPSVAGRRSGIVTAVRPSTRCGHRAMRTSATDPNTGRRSSAMASRVASPSRAAQARERCDPVVRVDRSSPVSRTSYTRLDAVFVALPAGAIEAAIRQVGTRHP